MFWHSNTYNSFLFFSYSAYSISNSFSINTIVFLYCSFIYSSTFKFTFFSSFNLLVFFSYSSSNLPKFSPVFEAILDKISLPTAVSLLSSFSCSNYFGLFSSTFFGSSYSWSYSFVSTIYNYSAYYGNIF